MGYDVAHRSETESVVPEEYGGMWFLKEPLNASELGLTVLELEPNAKGKQHDHSEDGQEEIYYVVEGEVDVELGDEIITLERGEAIRLDPGQRRQIHNHGDERATLVLAGAPLEE